MSKKRTLIITPTYNEVENIRGVLASLVQQVPQADILVVDDNSPDGTGKVVTESSRQWPQVHLLGRARKEGLARAYIAGFQWGAERGYDRFVQMDADFSHRPADVPALIQALDTHDVAIGCRYMDGGGTQGWSLLRQGISRGGNLYARRILGVPFQDLTGGFVGWRRDVLEKIGVDKLRSRGYCFQVELKYRAHRGGFRVVEVPILFENRRFGRSKMSGKIVWEAAFRVLQLRAVGA